MIEKLKAPFWFGLPGYAWLAGVVALVGGGLYFYTHRSSSATSAAQNLAAPVLDNSGVLNPYPSGGGTPVPPSNPIDPNGAGPPPSTQPGPWDGSGAHDPRPTPVAALSQHEKEWMKMHPGYTVTYERAHGL